jgi:hypothetical protein
MRALIVLAVVLGSLTTSSSARSLRQEVRPQVWPTEPIPSTVPVSTAVLSLQKQIMEATICRSSILCGLITAIVRNRAREI